MEHYLISKTRDLINNSIIIKYYDSERIEKVFSKINIYNRERDFNKLKYLQYYENKYQGARLEGFTSKEGTYIDEEFSTPHTVIHEALHELSKEYNENGNMIKNGIQGENNYTFASQVNEGLTDFLACKISKEDPRRYLLGHQFFSGIEEMMIQKYENENILWDSYFDNDTIKLQEFLDKYNGKGTFEKIYDEFLYINKEKMDKMLQTIGKNFEKDMRNQRIVRNIKNGFKKLAKPFTRFFKKDKTLYLSEGNINRKENINSHKAFEKAIKEESQTMNQQEISMKYIEKNMEDKEHRSDGNVR